MQCELVSNGLHELCSPDPCRVLPHIPSPLNVEEAEDDTAWSLHGQLAHESGCEMNVKDAHSMVDIHRSRGGEACRRDCDIHTSVYHFKDMTCKAANFMHSRRLAVD